ncbi:Hypothetical_protein [Hexamita inflata]|uniref:Hypothetical_protein n=1 Tax=Hexamita inflata TaxID=28002 RepID=A0AA86R5T2_9EUKA|nr:Hypothetical protein HINF_LOCUS58715 [Hexamita inflata]
MLQCRQYRDMQLASFCAALQTFGANPGDKRAYLRMIPQLARALNISDQLALEYARKHLQQPKYVLSEPLQLTTISDEQLNLLTDFFIPLEDKTEVNPLSQERNWQKLDEQYFEELTGDNVMWPRFAKMMESGSSVQDAMELREIMRTCALEYCKK